jgi:flagellar biosynthesis protein FlhG
MLWMFFMESDGTDNIGLPPMDIPSQKEDVICKPTIIPVAGGKGGIGKSFLSANLAIALAQKGYDTIAVDLDLGASSLFAFFGLTNRFPGIGDFVRAKRCELSELLVPTDVPKLRFLPGDGRSPFMANIAHAQKKKILRSLQLLQADYLVLDLGSGSTYNTLDFFSLGQTGIVMTTPEHPSMLKMLTFLKNLLLRKIENAIGTNVLVKSILSDAYDQPMEAQIQSLFQLEEKLAQEDPELAAAVEDIRRGFRPRIIFNMGTTPEDLSLMKHLDRSIETVLGIAADYFGFLYSDSNIRGTLQAKRPYLLENPDSITSQEIKKIAERICKYWFHSIPGSSELILARARKIYLESGMEEQHTMILPNGPS